MKLEQIFENNPLRNQHDARKRVMHAINTAKKAGMRRSADIYKWIKQNYPEQSYDFRNAVKTGLGLI